MFAIEQIGRKWALLIGGLGQALCLFFIGAYLKISPPATGATSPTPAGYVSIVAVSRRVGHITRQLHDSYLEILLSFSFLQVYLYVTFYGLGWRFVFAARRR